MCNVLHCTFTADPPAYTEVVKENGSKSEYFKIPAGLPFVSVVYSFSFFANSQKWCTSLVLDCSIVFEFLCSIICTICDESESLMWTIFVGQRIFGHLIDEICIQS